MNLRTECNFVIRLRIECNVVTCHMFVILLIIRLIRGHGFPLVGQGGANSDQVRSVVEIGVVSFGNSPECILCNV